MASTVPVAPAADEAKAKTCQGVGPVNFQVEGLPKTPPVMARSMTEVAPAPAPAPAAAQAAVALTPESLCGRVVELSMSTASGGRFVRVDSVEGDTVSYSYGLGLGSEGLCGISRVIRVVPAEEQVCL